MQIYYCKYVIVNVLSQRYYYKHIFHYQLNNLYLRYNMSDNAVVLENNFYVFKCPHCHQYVQVHQNEINCRIFRHAAYIKDMSPINPHASKEICNNLLESNQLYGCAKPFIFDNDNNGNMIVKICEYI